MIEIPEVYCRIAEDAVDHEDLLREFRSRLAIILAQEMSCLDRDGGTTVELDPDRDVRVFIDLYPEGRATSESTSITIVAHDYPDRMVNIDERVEAIKNGLRAAYPWLDAWIHFQPSPTRFWGLRS